MLEINNILILILIHFFAIFYFNLHSFILVANSNYSDESQKSLNFNSNTNSILNLTNDKEIYLKNKRNYYNYNILKGKNKFFSNRINNQNHSLQIPLEFNVNLNQVNIQNTIENDSLNSLKSYISKFNKNHIKI